MKALIVYDSKFGNTEKIARAIGDAITPLGEAQVVKTSDAKAAELSSIDFLQWSFTILYYEALRLHCQKTAFVF